MGRKRKRRKYEDGTADAFRFKKNLSKITIEEAEAIMKELDESYQEYRKPWLATKSKEEKARIEEKYLQQNRDTIQRIKFVGKHYDELIPGLMGVISDVYYNMKYTQLTDKRQIMQMMKERGEKKLAKMQQNKEKQKQKKRTKK